MCFCTATHPIPVLEPSPHCEALQATQFGFSQIQPINDTTTALIYSKSEDFPLYSCEGLFEYSFLIG